ncbi:electron transport complex subunit RsxG [Reinekea marina]|uniref:Ion-translocating oxidoreductase complex subunit G n=1 Tax=Reinekea marina TaxID=1310421 RepID=A0ABV7WRS9_9GAMM|nr:electron transport complex subunit RsxG [Reinekea marina]MDN3649280.1 electron transport complex subunit RsxG [Reinekea marina]
MSDTELETKITLSQSIRKAAIGLAIFALFTAGIIAVTQTLTKTTIVENEKAFEARLLLSLLPDGIDADNLLESAQSFQQAGISDTLLLNVENEQSFYQVKANNEVQSIIIPVIAPDGYTEGIRLIVGIDKKGVITGVRVTKHKETPGLGDQIEIEKSQWILNFEQTSLMNPMETGWKVKKDGGAFDQMTGATITPRAIVKAVYKALLFFEQNKDSLLAMQPDSSESK